MRQTTPIKRYSITSSRRSLTSGFSRTFGTVTPDGRWAVSGSGDWTVKVWEAYTGQCINTLFFDQALVAVVLHARPPLCLLVADNTERVSGYEVLQLPRSYRPERPYALLVAAGDFRLQPGIVDIIVCGRGKRERTGQAGSVAQVL